jgi:hypothetical protein
MKEADEVTIKPIRKDKDNGGSLKPSPKEETEPILIVTQYPLLDLAFETFGDRIAIKFWVENSYTRIYPEDLNAELKYSLTKWAKEQIKKISKGKV